MKGTDKDTLLYRRLYKALQQAAISEGQRFENKSHDQVQGCPLSKLSSIAILELKEYMDQLVDGLNMSNLVMFQGKAIRSFADAAYMVELHQRLIIALLSGCDAKEVLYPLEGVINCCDEFSGVNILKASRLAENFNQ